MKKKRILIAVMAVVLAGAIAFCFILNEEKSSLIRQMQESFARPALLVSEAKAEAEAVPEEEETEPEEDPYHLVQSENIEIPVFTEENLKKFDLPDSEAIRFVAKLKAGWNLGNTFDAYDEYNNSLGLRLETYWCGAKTTRELFHALKTAGFNLVRIPVSWHNHVTDENYTIDPNWIARVKEVAKWAADEDMYFIVNIHHDNSEKYFYPDEEHAAQSEKYLTAIWKQIAENFADFDDHCILESLNEPRLVGKSNEWYLDTSSASGKKAVEIINQWNQMFVDIVRGTGGNNATRYLSVPGYCASPASVLTDLFVMPKDTAENKIILEVHAYTPYSFALDKNSSDSSFDLENDKSKKQQIATFMNSLYQKYVSKGIPVIIDEFGALQKKSTDLQARVNFTAYYIASASTRGITCCWWDNHAFSGDGERFGIIDRNRIQWKYPDIALAILRNCTYNREQ